MLFSVDGNSKDYIVSVVGEWMSIEHRWNDSDGRKKTEVLWEKPVNVTLSTINLTWTGLELNLGLHSECWSWFSNFIHSPVWSRTAVIMYILTVNKCRIPVYPASLILCLCFCILETSKKNISINAYVLCLSVAYVHPITCHEGAEGGVEV